MFNLFLAMCHLIWEERFLNLNLKLPSKLFYVNSQSNSYPLNNQS